MNFCTLWLLLPFPLVLSASLTSCKHERSGPLGRGTAGTTTTAFWTTTTPEECLVTPPGSSTAPSPAPAPPPPVVESFEDAIRIGVEATVKKKDYPAAISAFERALAQRPGDPRAIFERGYARMMAGENELAVRDLKDANERAYSASLKGEILLAQAQMARFDGEKALEAKLRQKADALEKTRLRLDGGTCDIDVTRPNTSPIEAASFAAAWTTILEAHARQLGQPIPEDPDQAGFYLPMPVHASEAQARSTIVGKDRAGAHGWHVSTADTAFIHEHLVVALGKRLLVYPNLTTTMNGRCGNEGDAPVFRSGARPSITLVEEERSAGPLCAIDPKHCNPQGDLTVCVLAGWSYNTLVLDPTTMAVVLKVVERVNPKGSGFVKRHQPKVTVGIGADAVSITGCGANRREPLARRK
jgi:hypothetical protein